MNNPNPFVPKGSLLEQQSQRRSRLKLAVFCVLAISVTGLVAMLIQGCKREKPSDTDLNPPMVDTNAVPMDTNTLPMSVSNPPVVVPPAPTNPPVIIPPVAPVEPVAAVGSEYVVVKGDTLAKIAKKNGVSTKALQAANPGVVPTKLKIGQKLTIPAGGKISADAAAPSVAAGGDTGGATYTVKSGDTLTKIAKKNGTTAKAIQAANGLTTTKIKVGQKLKIPSKAEAAAPAAPAPVVDTTPAPALPPVTAPAAPAPAPAH
jgi:LysM repeat protein